jgi:acetylglutamate/LysW-gamma-L-alpha-aminoadipate kinase
LQRLGANAVGLTGVDGRLLEGERKDTIRAVENGKRLVLRGDYTGTIERVNAPLLRLLIDEGYLPVVTVPAISTAGEAVNADADRAAAAIAGALDADHLVILSNVAGLLRDVKDPGSLVTHIPVAEIDAFEAFAQGRFKKKLLGAREALDLGVAEIIFATANSTTPVQAALNGGGTHIS